MNDSQTGLQNNNDRFQAINLFRYYTKFLRPKRINPDSNGIIPPIDHEWDYWKM
jgi:hypothetical protein